VAISPERNEEPVRRFDCFTADLEQMADMADWLVDREVRMRGHAIDYSEV
jgi:hypothetical protein